MSVPLWGEAVVAGLLVLSGLFVLISALGFWRLPDFFLRMHAPGTLEPGSSVSHYSTAVTPDEVMEPVINLNSVLHDPGRAVPLMRDIGWTLASGGGGGSGVPAVFRNGFEN